MATVKNKNTKPEILVRKALFKRGFRYRINNKKLPGSPDIVLPKYNSAIFIHGCFWHGHSNCMKAIKPNSNVTFWQSKILKNKARDNKVERELHKIGWNVFIIWECELRNKETFDKTLNKLLTGLQKNCRTFAAQHICNSPKPIHKQ